MRNKSSVLILFSEADIISVSMVIIILLCLIISENVGILTQKYWSYSKILNIKWHLHTNN